MCEHQGHLINQGIWWCNLQSEDKEPNQTHLNCDCKNCPDYKEYSATECYSEVSIKQNI